MKNLNTVAVLVLVLAFAPIAHAGPIAYEGCETEDICLAIPSEAPTSVTISGEPDTARAGSGSMLTAQDLPGRSERLVNTGKAGSFELPLALSQGIAIQNQLRQLDNFLYVLPYRAVAKGNPTISISGLKK